MARGRSAAHSSRPPLGIAAREPQHDGSRVPLFRLATSRVYIFGQAGDGAADTPASAIAAVAQDPSSRARHGSTTWSRATVAPLPPQPHSTRAHQPDRTRARVRRGRRAARLRALAHRYPSARPTDDLRSTDPQNADRRPRPTVEVRPQRDQHNRPPLGSRAAATRSSKNDTRSFSTWHTANSSSN